MLEVAVIGAGASGLVAARHLIHAGLRPTIFEAAKTIGGAWTPSSSSALTPPSSSSQKQLSNDNDDHHHPASKMWNGMNTNLSKYTCRFSDWPWPDDANVFPSVDEMHDYLESYADEFLTASTSSPSSIPCNFRLECKVFNVESSSSQAGQQDGNDNNKYKVEWTDLNTQTTHSRDFGGVVVAAGFFHTPRWPAFLKNRIREEVLDSSKRPRLMHSSEYKSHFPFQDKNVAVIGSSFSALEIAAHVSQSAARVVNVSPSIPWVLPRWIPTITQDGKNKDGGTTMNILPVDMVLFKRKSSYPQKEEISMTPDDCRKRHEYLRSLVGHKQRNSTLGEPTDWEEPALVAISDEYVDLIREGKVEVIHGRLVGMEEDGTLQIGNAPTAAGSEVPQPHSSLSGIDHIICCTGYTSQLHDFLSSDILSALNYESEDTFCPMTLSWDVLHPTLPNLAFCGMYRGPYMGTMDLQARLAAGVMSGKISISEDEYDAAMKTSQTIRNYIPRAQFPHFDYPGYMDSLSQLCYSGNYRPKYNTDIGDMIVPTFYQQNEKLSDECSLEMQKEIERGQDGSRMPKIVLQSILGSWSFDRHIVHLQTRKVERVYGTVKFSKYWERSSSSDNGNDNGDDKADNLFSDGSKGDNPVLYREDGFYEYSPTQSFEVFREYEYECNHDALEIYFVEAGKRAHLFLSLKFLPETMTALEQKFDEDGGYWVKATSDHLCIKDLYSATFRVKLNGLSASEIVIKYRVKGPAKDYESTTILRPNWS